MKISVAICTWNRAELLDQTLARLRALHIPAGLWWELLVVNNNCSDHTDAVLDKHREALPLVRIFEVRQGLSNARNAAISHAAGDYIVWTDDDVLVSPTWLQAYADAFARWPDAGAFGGKVLPWFASPPPAWLSRHIDRLGEYYALRDFGDDEIVLPKGKTPFGANMAFPAAVLREHGFNPELGRTGKNMASGEDAEVIARIRSQGKSVVWIPVSVVEHFIPPERMNLDYLRNLAFARGRHELPLSGNRRVFGLPLWTIRRWVYSEAAYRYYRYLKPYDVRWIDALIEAHTCRGLLARAGRPARS